jgi:DNA polymerase-3 subunit beta
MNLTIPVSTIQAARKLLTWIRFERLKLPVLTHVLATIDAAGLSFAVTDLDHWLETRVPATIDPFQPVRFLIPAEALKAATRGDKKSSAQFAYTTTADGTTLTLTVSCGGMNVVTIYHPEPAADFPARPTLEGRITAMPKETLQALGTVAGSASTDATRYVLNGVLFSPDDGGILVATDGRRLAGAPVRFAGREFILPNAAVHVLAHPDFTARDAAILQPDAAENIHVQFRSGPHTLIARRIEGNYPNYRQVVPHQFLADATIPETHRSALISWLRSLAGKSNSVRLTWGRPGPLTLTHRDRDSDAVVATMQVPVTTSGVLPAISFSPQYLADALVIGSTLRLIDGISPGLVTNPSGCYCVLMPCRCVTEAVMEEAVDKSSAPAMAA